MNSFLVFINFVVNSFTKVNHFTRVYTYAESFFLVQAWACQSLDLNLVFGGLVVLVAFGL